VLRKEFSRASAASGAGDGGFSPARRPCWRAKAVARRPFCTSRTSFPVKPTAGWHVWWTRRSLGFLPPPEGCFTEMQSRRARRCDAVSAGDAGGCRTALVWIRERPVLLVTGGSQGQAASTNWSCKPCRYFAVGAADLQWVHLTGINDFGQERTHDALQFWAAYLAPNVCRNR